MSSTLTISTTLSPIPLIHPPIYPPIYPPIHPVRTLPRTSPRFPRPVQRLRPRIRRRALGVRPQPQLRHMSPDALMAPVPPLAPILGLFPRWPPLALQDAPDRLGRHFELLRQHRRREPVGRHRVQLPDPVQRVRRQLLLRAPSLPKFALQRVLLHLPSLPLPR